MISRVLVPMDDSEMAGRALDYALEAHPDADITVLHIVGEPSAMMGKAVGLALKDDMNEAAEEHAAAIFERARASAQSRGVDISTEVAWGNPGKVIVKQADAFDVVVIGSHGGSLADRLFVGNVAQTVFRRAAVPVTVVR